MKNAWKKTLAGMTALILVAGAMPANVGGFLTKSVGIVASAASETETFNYELRDGYGDGWNGAKIEIYEGDSVVSTLTFGSGEEASGSINLEEGKVYKFKWVKGMYDDECSFTFKDANNQVVYRCGGASILSEEFLSYENGSFQVPDAVYLVDGIPFYTEWTSTDSLPTSDGNYYLTGDVTLSAQQYSNFYGKINLYLNDHSITTTYGGSLITLNGGNGNYGFYGGSSTEGDANKIKITDPQGTITYISGDGTNLLFNHVTIESDANRTIVQLNGSAVKSKLVLENGTKIINKNAENNKFAIDSGNGYGMQIDNSEITGFENVILYNGSSYGTEYIINGNSKIDGIIKLKPNGASTPIIFQEGATLTGNHPIILDISNAAVNKPYVFTSGAGDNVFTIADSESGYSVRKNNNGEWEIYDNVYTLVEAKEASCTEPGNIEYYEGSDNKIYTKSGDTYTKTTLEAVTIPVKEHIFANIWSWTKTDDGYKAKVIHKCARCGEGQKINAVVSSAEVNGKIVYTANATVDGQELTDTKEIDIDYTFAVEGGTITSGEKTSYNYGDAVTVQADAMQDGKYFSGWYIGDTLITTQQSYTFFVKQNMVATAKYEGSDVAEENADVSVMINRTNIESNKQKVVFSLNWALPQGCTLKETGILRRYDNTDNLTFAGVDGTTVKRHASTLKTRNGNCNFILTVSATTKMRSINSVAYIIYTDEIGEEHTELKPVVTSIYE
jgi:hypothetical protein